MRYNTHIPDLILLQNNGVAAYSFGLQGILDLGSGVFIDAAPGASSSTDLMLLRAAGLLGRTTDYIERAGQGSLTSSDCLGSALPSLVAGYNGLFFEAPEIVPTTSTVLAIANIKYIVLRGTVTYNSVAYIAGEEFVSDGTTVNTTTADSGVFALSIPEQLASANTDFSTEAFKINQTLHGDEALNAYKRNAYGYTPRADVTSNLPTYYGWKRDYTPV